VLSSIAILLLSVIGWLIWRLALTPLFRSKSTIDLAGPEGAQRDHLSAVSIIVPARDEAHNLPMLLASLPAGAEVLVVNDQSADSTEAVAAEFGAAVITGSAPPAGWLGKSWACQQGAERARGEFLLFTDADTVHGPELLPRALHELRSEQADLVSVIPWHQAFSAWEKLQGAFQLLLLIAAGLRPASTPAASERCFAIGQFLLFRTESYRRAGGHAAVKNRIAEDLAFARTVRELGGRYALVIAPGALKVRMYPEGFVAFVRGWRRNFREGVRSAGGLAALEIALVLSWLLGAPLGMLLGWMSSSLSLFLVSSVSYGVATVLVGHAQRKLGGFPFWSAPLYPLATLCFVVVSLLASIDALLDKPVNWRGRLIAPAARTVRRA
jgi:4,4'-diaponeurosporenoate glycosyltransferase